MISRHEKNDYRTGMDIYSPPPSITDRVEVVEGRFRHVIDWSEFEALRSERFFRDDATVRRYFEEYPQPVYQRRIGP